MFIAIGPAGNFAEKQSAVGVLEAADDPAVVNPDFQHHDLAAIDWLIPVHPVAVVAKLGYKCSPLARTSNIQTDAKIAKLHNLLYFHAWIICTVVWLKCCPV